MEKTDEISEKEKKYNNRIYKAKNIKIFSTLFEGQKIIKNWENNLYQQTNIIKDLKVGDEMITTVSAFNPGEGCQFKIAWGKEENQGLMWTNCYKNGDPYDYQVILSKEIVNSIKASNELYLSGNNIKIENWKVIQNKNISLERGNAFTKIWEGSQVIDSNSSPKKYVSLESHLFSEAQEDMKIRINYKDMKLFSRGRITSINWTPIPDADTDENLLSSWGDYYEFTITNNMLKELKKNGMNVSGDGYTLISVELIDPMKEYAITATFNKDDIKAWEKNEGTPKITITLSNFEENQVTTSVSASLITDMYKLYFQRSIQNIKLEPGETKDINIEFPFLIPGFYKIIAKANENSLFNYYIGYDPTNIYSPNDAQPDFWEFWDNWKNELSKIDMKPEISLMDELSSGSRFIYEIKMMSIPDTKGGEPVPIWGYYAEPKLEGKYPCIINVHGTDNGSGVPPVPGTNNNIDWCEFNFSARGQMLSRIKNGNKYKVNNEADFYSYGLGDNDEHYYRAAYLDTIRPIDFVYTREKVNKNAIFVAGGSQGGCFSYVCAALGNGRIKAIAPWITGHADFVDTMEIVEWPTNKFNEWINKNYPNEYKKGKEILLKHQSYFDTKNFVSRIKCPVTTNFSLQDKTDGPHLNISPYNLLTKVDEKDKQYSINPFLDHSCKDGWTEEYISFFEKYIDKEVVNINESNYGTYYNSTAIQLPKGMKAGTIDDINLEENKINVNWRYDGNKETKNIIPGGTAVILKANKGNYKLKLLPENKIESPKENLLHGSDVRTLTSGGDIYYKLSYGPQDNDQLKDKLGWYYGSQDGKAFYMEDHKAWLALNKNQAISKTFSI